MSEYCIAAAQVLTSDFRCLQNELKFYDQVKHEEITELIKTVDDIRLQQWRAQGQDLINDARRVSLSQYSAFSFTISQHAVAKVFQMKAGFPDVAID